MADDSKRPKAPSGSFWHRVDFALQLEIPVLVGVLIIAAAILTGREIPLTEDYAVLIGLAVVFGPLLLLFHFARFTRKAD